MTIYQNSCASMEYDHILYTMSKTRERELNERTGKYIRIIKGGISFKLCFEHNKLPSFGFRRIHPYIAAAETAWQLMGTRDPAWINKKAPKLWSKFVESDGTVPACYGYRWRNHFNRDQIQCTIDELINNPTNRQLFISAWDPKIDGLGGPQPKNIPCPVGFAIHRYKNSIHGSVFLRSSDVFVGLPYDIINYALLFDAISQSCKCKLSSIHFTLAHAHLYEDHMHMLVYGFNNKTVIRVPEPYLPNWTVDGITKNPDKYVYQVKLASKLFVKSREYNPKPKVIV